MLLRIETKISFFRLPPPSPSSLIPQSLVPIQYGFFGFGLELVFGLWHRDNLRRSIFFLYTGRHSKRVRISWLWHYIHISIFLYTNSWSEPFSRHKLDVTTSSMMSRPSLFKFYIYSYVLVFLHFHRTLLILV